MNDLIDRQAAIDAVKKLRDDCVKYYGKRSCKGYWELTVAMSVIKTVPSAQPERKKGRWIDLDSDTEKYDDIMCSNCKQSFTVDAYRWCDIGFTVDDLKFCPNCGADMRGADE